MKNDLGKVWYKTSKKTEKAIDRIAGPDEFNELIASKVAFWVECHGNLAQALQMAGQIYPLKAR